MTTIDTILKETKNLLETAESPNPQTEAELIISEILNVNKLELYLNPTEEVDKNHHTAIQKITRKRCVGEPLQYILGKAYFMNLELNVGPGVLIPRPETELLVDYVCQRAPQKARICDIGTGSGTISLSIAYERPDTHVIGLDLKEDALFYAKQNKEKYELKNVELIQSNLLSAVEDKQFEVITANLPYVSQTEYDRLPDEVKDHEPKSALYADNRGLALIEDVIKDAPNYLTKNGLIILEIGFEQGPEVKDLFDRNDNYKNSEIIKDLNNHDRFVKAVKK